MVQDGLEKFIKLAPVRPTQARASGIVIQRFTGGQGRKVAGLATLKERNRFGCIEFKNSQPCLETARTVGS
jgi:hypothetical protein